MKFSLGAHFSLKFRGYHYMGFSSDYIFHTQVKQHENSMGSSTGYFYFSFSKAFLLLKCLPKAPEYVNASSLLVNKTHRESCVSQ